MNELDTDLYSRMIGTYGIEIMEKITKLKVYIHGIRGIGIETAKNLILTGINTIVIHDDSFVELRDLGSNFCLTPEDVGNATRAEASVNKLQELNPTSNVILYTGELTEEFISNFDIVFFTESDKATLLKFNQFCRSQKKPIGFISCEN